MEIIPATEKDVPIIRALAEAIWWPTYRLILSEEQISFMLEDMYSERALKEQMRKEIKFLLVKRYDTNVAFAGYSIEGQKTLKIHKLYILPSEQGKGTGKILVSHLMDLAQRSNIAQVELNVNRKNPALGFYEKMGFKIVETVDIPYHQFILNDYVMLKMI